VNAINGDGNTPLLQAARFPAEFKVLKLLLTQKVNVNAQNKRGMTALHYLTIRHTDYRDYDTADGQGYVDPDELAPWQRPSGWELDEGKRSEAIKLLVAAGADPSIRNARGESALDLARRYPVGAEIVRLLEAKAAEVRPQ
jgi:ankyrin repeat protein